MTHRISYLNIFRAYREGEDSNVALERLIFIWNNLKIKTFNNLIFCGLVEVMHTFLC